MSRLESFRKERERLNARVLETATLETKRFFSLDGQTYRPGALTAKTKELMGLVASMVLRCDDCISYHLIRCAEEGVTDGEFQESFSVALIVGGSIVIPHLRRAVDFLDEIRGAAKKKQGARPKKPKRG
jgi:AhpD family alkylhydroperoxidase